MTPREIVWQCLDNNKFNSLESAQKATLFAKCFYRIKHTNTKMLLKKLLE